MAYSRKHSKRLLSKSVPNPFERNLEDSRHNVNNEHLQHNEHGDTSAESSFNVAYIMDVHSSTTAGPKGVENFEIPNAKPLETSETEITSKRTLKKKNGGIFKYLEGPVAGDAEHNLSAALICYEEARKAFGGFPSSSTEIPYVIMKKGWVCNELGRNRLEIKELNKVEVAFINAINAFKEVSDHADVILSNYNLGHDR